MRLGGLLLFVALLLAGCVNLGSSMPPTPDAPVEGSAPATPPTPSPTSPSAATPTPAPTEPTTGPDPAPAPPPETPAEPTPSPTTSTPAPAPPPSTAWPEPSDPARHPAVRFAPGADASAGSSFASATIAPDRTSFSASLRGVSEATLRVDDLVRVRNTEDRAQTIQVSTAQIVDERIVAARLLVGAQSVDLRSAAPSLTLELAPQGSVRVGFELTVAGVESEEIVLSQAVALVVQGS